MNHQPNAVALVPTMTIILLSMSAAVSSTSCNQTCPNGDLKDKHILYPFGFSDGCKIPLDCDKSGNLYIGKLHINHITEDSIWVNYRPVCNRSRESTNHLFGQNYGPTSENLLLLMNCSSPFNYNYTKSQIRNSSWLEPEECNNTNNNSVSCFTDGQDGEVKFWDKSELNQIDCKVSFSSTVVGRSLNRVKLGWLLEGSCNCSANAKCINVSLPGEKSGFQCECNEGYNGDG